MSIYNKYINKQVFLVTKRDFTYKGTITEVDIVERKINILDRKVGDMTIDFDAVSRIEPRGEEHG